MSGLVPFKKGHDPRRNTRGMPKDAIRVRKMIRKLAEELVITKDGGKNREVTRLEKLVLGMLSSDSPVDRVNILKALYPELFEQETKGKGSLGPVRLNVVYVDNRGKQNVPREDIIDAEASDE